MHPTQEAQASADILINKLTELGMMIRAFPNRHDVVTETGMIRADFYNLPLGELDSKFHEFVKAYQDVLGECDSRLILGTGDNNWEAHRMLAQRGFYVRCGERDAFGWLSGIIRSRDYNFELVYG